MLEFKNSTDTKENMITNKCGTITCIHCIGNRCSIGKCDFYERAYCQED